MRKYIAESLLGWAMAIMPKSPESDRLRDAVKDYDTTKTIQKKVANTEAWNVETAAVERKLAQAGYVVTKKKNIQYATQLILSNGSILNCYSNGKVFAQGTKDEKLSKLFA